MSKVSMGSANSIDTEDEKIYFVENKFFNHNVLDSRNLVPLKGEVFVTLLID